MDELKQKTVDINAIEVKPDIVMMAISPDGENVIKQACRTCYLSSHRYHPSESTKELLKKVIQKKHHSVLERVHWEMRQICKEILRILKMEAPNVFWDLEIDYEACIVRNIA